MSGRDGTGGLGGRVSEPAGGGGVGVCGDSVSLNPTVERSYVRAGGC